MKTDHNNIEDIFEELLTRTKSGELPADILDEYPEEYRDELIDLLELTGELEHLPESKVNPSALLHCMAELTLKERQVKQRSRLLLFPRLFVRFAAVITLTFFLAVGSIYASSNAMPRDFLYSLKLLTEKIHFMLLSDKKDRAELRLTFSDRRLTEAVKSFRENKKLDLKLLDQMLIEARKALKDSGNLQNTEKHEVLSRIDYAMQHQEKSLQKLYNTCNASQKKSLVPYLCACNARCKMVNNIMNSIKNIPEKSMQTLPCGCSSGQPCNKSRTEKQEWKRIYPAAGTTPDVKGN